MFLQSHCAIRLQYLSAGITFQIDHYHNWNLGNAITDAPITFSADKDSPRTPVPAQCRSCSRGSTCDPVNAYQLLCDVTIWCQYRADSSAYMPCYCKRLHWYQMCDCTDVEPSYRFALLLPIAEHMPFRTGRFVNSQSYLWSIICLHLSFIVGKSESLYISTYKRYQWFHCEFNFIWCRDE